MGPFDAWPTGGGGFEYFYGFIGGETNQYYPAIYEGTTPVEPEKTPEEGYHFTEDMTDKAIKWVAPAEVAHARQAVLHVLRAGRDARSAPRADGVVGQVQGPLRRGLGRAARGDPRRARRSSASCPRTTELTARHEEIPAWDDMPDELKPVLARQMEVYAGFLEHTDHHIGRLVDALDDLGVLEDTLVYYIIGDNGASAEGTVNGTLQRDVHLQRRRRARDARVRGRAHRRVRHADGLQPLTRSAGRTRWTRPTSGRSRSPRTGAERATARSCTGRAGFAARGRGALAVPPRDRRRPDRARGRRASPADEPSTASQQQPIEGVSMALLVRRRGRGRPPRDAVLRDVLQPRHLPPGLDRGHPPLDAVGDGAQLPAVRGRRLGALRHETDWSQAHDLAAEMPEKLAELQAALARGGAQVQRAPARRPAHRALQRRPRRPPGAREGQLAAALRRHGPPQREQRSSTSRTSRTRSRRRSSCPRRAPRA